MTKRQSNSKRVPTKPPRAAVLGAMLGTESAASVAIDKGDVRTFCGYVPCRTHAWENTRGSRACRVCGLRLEQVPTERQPLALASESELSDWLAYHTTPGAHTVSDGKCGHAARGGLHCANCIDAELLRRGVDVVECGTRYAYKRFVGGIRRKIKGGATR